MPTLVSTGQLTIIDQNDARSITAFLTAGGGTQQVFTKDDTTTTFIPDWFATALTLTPTIAISGLTTNQVWASLINKQFALTAGGTALATGTTSTSFVNSSNTDISTPFTVTHGANGATTVSTLAVKGNLKDTVTSYTVFFDADYLDSATGLTTHITCQITLSTVKTGTNAVYVTFRGKNAIEEATGSTKNNATLCADLIRSSGLDTSGLTYKWFEASSGTQISTSLSGYASKYGFKTTASNADPTSSSSDLGVNVPTVGSGNAHNTIVISESAVTDMASYRVEITDTSDPGKTYAGYVTVYDVTDPYDVQIISSTGDKLLNGQGSTTLTPKVIYGSNVISDLTGWTFDWTIYDRNGKRAAFVDTAKISAAGGAPVTANSTGTSATITYSGTSYAFAAGDVVKVVKPNGDAYFYEVASSTTNIVTIRSPSTNTWLSFTNYPAPVATTDFVGGKLYGCTTQGKRSTSAAGTIVVTGDEIDSKGVIWVEANRP